MPSISAAWQWAVNTCNDPNVGYSQAHREQETINGITYYDCSSFIWYALVAGGFPLTGTPFTTVSMVNELLNIGFTEVPLSGVWVAGDIVWKPGHCEMVYSGTTGSGITMGAHSDSLPLADQVSINSSPSSASAYTMLLRFTGTITRQWIIGTHAQLFDYPSAEMNNNALCVRDWWVINTDWTLEAIAALTANMQGESTINPASMENPNLPIGTVNQDGIGLVQWTTDTQGDPNPLFNILDYLYGSHTNWEEPNGQCNAIMAEYGKAVGTIPSHTVPDFDSGWIPTNDYPMSFYDWAHSTQDPGYLADAFRRNYERGVDPYNQRPGWARAWYQYFLDNPFIPPTPVRRKGLKIWQMIRYHY